MRTALRTPLVTAALAGLLLAPATGAALAAGHQPGAAGAARATVHGTVSAAATAGTANDDSRYLGAAVPIGNGEIAVLRNNDKTGPEAWIRYVGLDWTPGDTYMVHVDGLLDARHTTKRLNGLKLALVKLDSARPELKVTRDGSIRVATYKLPVRNSDAGRGCVSQITRQDLGAGVFADLTTSPKGPKAVLRDAGTPTKSFATLDRSHPSLPASSGIIVRILKPATAKPVLEWKTQGGGTPFGHRALPALPKGCAPAQG